MNKINSVLLILSLLVYGIPILTGNVNAEVAAYQPQIGNFTSSNAFVTPDYIFTLNCIVNDLDGRETLENASIELSEGVIILWKNEANSFNLYQNLHDFARLESGSYSSAVNSSARALNFKPSYQVNMTHGPVSVQATVYDNSSLCGYGNHTDLFVFGPEPEAWQQNPSNIPQSGHALGIEEAVVILVVSLIIIAILSLFASRRKKSTQEKYHELIDVQPKRREK